MGTGTHVVAVAIGYVRNGTAPIIDHTLDASEAVLRVVDPIPSALVVTAIVIGMAVTAVMLAFAIRLYDSKKTLSIDAFTDFKMVTGLLHPLNIFILGLGAGFMISLFYRLGSTWVAAVFVLSLAAMTLISGHAADDAFAGRGSDRNFYGRQQTFLRD